MDGPIDPGCIFAILWYIAVFEIHHHLSSTSLSETDTYMKSRETFEKCSFFYFYCNTLLFSAVLVHYNNFVSPYNLMSLELWKKIWYHGKLP